MYSHKVERLEKCVQVISNHFQSLVRGKSQARINGAFWKTDRRKADLHQEHDFHVNKFMGKRGILLSSTGSPSRAPPSLSYAMMAHTRHVLTAK